MNYRLCFQVYLRRQGKSPATTKRYSRALSEFLSHRPSRLRRENIVKRLQIENIETYWNYLATMRGLRPSTINGRLTALSNFARFLMGKGILGYNPLEIVTRLKENSACTPPCSASPNSVQALRSEVHSDVLELPGRVIVEFLYAGLSVREVCVLLKDLQNSDDHLVLDDRQVKLHSEARLALEHYMILKPILLGDRLIVGNSRDGFLKPGEVYYLLRRFSRKIGTRVRVRDLRFAKIWTEEALFQAEEVAA
ncbi:MAG: phage integrase N-terminal SAM-like domain-containing protein [Syntrophomonadaceae bacterium]